MEIVSIIETWKTIVEKFVLMNTILVYEIVNNEVARMGD